LVVKNGSKMRGTMSLGMPVPLSATQIDRYWPVGRSQTRAERSSSHLFAVDRQAPALRLG
jgi:hypothetical protein